LAASRYIRAMHPKTEIRSDRATIEKVLSSGWVGQLKIHGHRAQIHLPSDSDQPVIAYNRQGEAHKKLLPPEIIAELNRLFRPAHGWSVIDAEWIKPKNKLFIFDFLKKEDELLSHLNYAERHRLLPREYLSPYLSTLPLLNTIEKCLQALAKPDPHLEGLVFKSLNTPGFSDTSIVRCRRTSPSKRT